MIDGIQPTTVLEVGQIMAEAMGKDWVRDRKEIVDYINRFREDLYLMYPEFKLFTNKFYCLEICCFPEDCLSPCSCSGNTYRGVTLPEDIDGVIGIWEDHTPLRIYSKWWEGRVGRVTKDQPRTDLSATLIHEQFATQRPLQCPSILKIYASSSEDTGKIFMINARTMFKRSQEFTVELHGDGIVRLPEEVTAIHSVTVPSGLHGTITLMQEDGYELDVYSGYDTVPARRRLKISSECPSDRVLVHGNQKFKPVFFDSDIVEVGSRRIVETAARVYRYGETGTNEDEIRKAAIEESKMKKLIRGALERTRGKASQDPSQFVRKSLIKSRRLPGYEGLRNYGSRRRCNTKKCW